MKLFLYDKMKRNWNRHKNMSHIRKVLFHCKKSSCGMPLKSRVYREVESIEPGDYNWAFDMNEGDDGLERLPKKRPNE